MSHSSDTTPKSGKYWGRIRFMGLTFFLIVLGTLIAGAVYQAIATGSGARRFPPPGSLVSVGTHALHIQRSGAGGPVVILEAGAGGTSLDWSKVQPELAQSMTVVSYDRAGLGWSESGPLPRTSGRIAEELHALLRASEIAPPYILVGHSFGGLNMRMFASKYPEEVSGLVLVDSIHEDFYVRMPNAVEQSRTGQLEQLSMAPALSLIGLPRLLFPPLATQGLSDSVQDAANARGYLAETYSAVHDEAFAFDQSAEEVKAANPIRSDLPVVVLSRSTAEAWPPSVSQEEAEGIWQELQAELSKLTSKTTQTIVDDSGHYIHLEQPKVVVDAIQTIVATLAE